MGDTERREALTSLAVLHHGPLFGYCLKRLGTEQDADDALQETFIRAFKYYHTFDQERDARKWLFGIAHNVCVEVARARTRHRTVEVVPDEGGNHTAEALEQLSHRESVGLAREELSKMPDGARRILELRFFGEMSAREIAEVEGITETAVRVRVFRGLKQLRARMAGGE